MKANPKRKRKTVPVQAPTPDAVAPEITTCPAVPTPPKPEDAPVSIKDTPESNPAITQDEVGALYNAYFTYQLTAADLERRRGQMRLRLLQLADVEPGNFEISLTEDGKLLCISHESVEEEHIIIS